MELKRLRFPIMVGKNTRNLVFLFTDMKRLRGMYDEEWSAFSQKLEKFTDIFDVGINISKNYSLGCYVNKDTVDEIKRVFLGVKPEDINDSAVLQTPDGKPLAKPEEGKEDDKKAEE